MILRPGKTPGGAEVALVLRHVVKAIRARWPRVDILVRGDSHYGRPEAMTWCDQNRVGNIFGLAGNPVLLTKVAALAEDAAVSRAQGEIPAARCHHGRARLQAPRASTDAGFCREDNLAALEARRIRFIPRLAARPTASPTRRFPTGSSLKIESDGQIRR